jgi:hypothetical protein
MNGSKVYIDFEILTQEFSKFVREKAKSSGSNIVYKKENQVIEENPRTAEKRILKSYSFPK